MKLLEPPKQRKPLKRRDMSFTYIDALVLKVYGQEFDSDENIWEEGEDSHYAPYTLPIEKEPDSEYDLNMINEWLKDPSKGCQTCVLLQDLCNKGHLKPGDYLIYDWDLEEYSEDEE